MSRKDVFAGIMSRIKSSLRQVRQRQGLAQRELAMAADISRQALSELEAGHACPSTAVALALAQALHCRVEDLFFLSEDDAPVQAEWALLEGNGTRRTRAAQKAGRAALAFIGDRWVAHALNARQPASMWSAADGLVLSTAPSRRPASGGSAVELEPLRSRSAIRENVLLAGCDPAIGLLSAWLGERHRPAKVTWLYATSDAALGALARREVHIAGAHLLDEVTGEFNVPFARSAVQGDSAVVVNFARWEEGLVVARGNPRGIRGVPDLARRRITFVNREVGSGARKLLDRLLHKEGMETKRLKGYERVARGHMAVAHAVALGAADAGIATRSAAAALGLRFLPLSEERFDLVVPKPLLAAQGVARLLDGLATRAFHRELESLAGYATDRTGDVVAEVGS
jgi:molybdate-binding protein/DNA-binding XRE family transcriptional regulator